MTILDVNQFREQLLITPNEISFLTLISQTYLNHSSEDSKISEEIIKIHNQGLRDVVECFSKLKNESTSEVNFFLVRQIFEQVLPNLKAPVVQVMQCVLHLVKVAGQDMTAGSVYIPFTEFCTADSFRPKECLSLIESSKNEYNSFLVPTLIAGSRIDHVFYFNETLRLLEHDDVEVRRIATFALGRLVYPKNSNSLQESYQRLGKIIGEQEDEITLANAINTLIELYKIDKTHEALVARLIDITLSKGSDLTLHEASRLFGLHGDEIPDSIDSIFLGYLWQTKAGSQSFLQNIDYGLNKLIKKGKEVEVVGFLEKLISRNKGKINFHVFNQTGLFILNNQRLLGHLVTKWFLTGDKGLCEAIESLVRLAHNNFLPLSIDPTELDSTNPDGYLFVARKAIGYLFLEPVTVSCILISLIQHSEDDTTIQKISELLYDPLLINYPRQVSDYLEQQIDAQETKVHDAIESAIKNFEQYLEHMKSAGEIPELHPSQENREVYGRKLQREVSEAMKNAEKQSTFLSIIPKSILLYGRKSIDYSYDIEGQARRIEIPLKSFESEMKLPRLETIDPFGLDYMIRIFKAEQMIKHETYN